MLGQLFDKPGSEKGLTVKKAVELQNNYKAKKTTTKKEPPSTKKKLTGSDEQTTTRGRLEQWGCCGSPLPCSEREVLGESSQDPPSDA